MADKVQRMLWIVELLVVAAAVVAMLAGRLDVRWSFVLFSVHLIRLLIAAWIGRPPRKREFRKPRSEYPHGDNGYNTYLEQRR